MTSDEAEPVNEPAVDGRNDGVEADLLDGERDSDAGESTETVRGVVGDWRIAPSEAIVGVWKAGVMRDAGRGGRGVVGEVPGVGGRWVAGEDESWPRLRVYVSSNFRCSVGVLAARQAQLCGRPTACSLREVQVWSQMDCV